MKKRYLLVVYIILIIAAVLIYFFTPYELIIKWLIVVNIIIYLIRTPIIRIVSSIFKKKPVIRIVISFGINITWAVFIMWLILAFSYETFIALLSFLIVAISLTFKETIKNITSGFFILTTEQFEVGDFIETNDIQGIVQKINLNSTKIKEIDGVTVFIPNKKVFSSTLIKYTQKLKTLLDFSALQEDSEKEQQERNYYKDMLKLSDGLFSEDKEITRYDKSIEITSAVDPEELEEYLSEIFDKYESLFKYRPDYVVDLVTVNRCRIDLLITAKSPELLLKHLDAFLKDVLFKLHSPAIYDGWTDYRKSLLKEADK
ncbi:MAG: mechanosensitive ion channel [Promethearchaeota archaeon]|nr:MAG: mechanosensitive ion channel [Candidatus Lokiarchaeota archaeon]